MEKYRKVLEHIDKMWVELIKNSRDCPKDPKNVQDDMKNFFLPYDFVAPGGMFDCMFYWDSYFTMTGLRYCPRLHYLMKSMVDNCIYMIHHFGRVSNSNKKAWSSRSQLPYLTSMIKLAYEVYEDNVWLDFAMGFAIREYEKYWCISPHLVDVGLSRFYEDSGDNFITRNSEVSWDCSPRYDDDDTTSLLPVDLNANLFTYERDFAEYFARKGAEAEAKKWLERAEKRKALMFELMWDEEECLFFDYNFERGKKKYVRSLASYVPMWAGMVDAEVAQKLVDKLSLFEHEFGLVTCDHDYGYKDRQWNYPLGWAPLHYMVCVGLRRYGYEETAVRIAKKFLDLVTRVFEKTQAIWEKYDCVRGDVPGFNDRYPTQAGFGWTNGVFLALLHEFVLKSL